MCTQQIIGVAGGMGLYAGLDLVKKIFDQILLASLSLWQSLSFMTGVEWLRGQRAIAAG
jgi:hypothetical protein